MDLPEATIFISGSNKWHKFDTWPPKDALEKALYFHANGNLSDEKPSETNGFEEYESDPGAPVPYQAGIQSDRTREYMIDDQRFAARRPDVKVYQTDLLTADVTLTAR